ncbi:MAG TPA: TldD/PmbA family protein [Actinomycetota bacterium]|nr:TldD/PmbA family protein [Actinomycetota bacterium]
MSDDRSLLDLALRIAARASEREDVEAYVTHARNFNVKVYDGEVESLSSAEPRGAGVRVLAGGRVGFAYSTDLSETGLDELVARGRDNARHADPDDAAGLAERADGDSLADLVDDAHAGVAVERKVEFALDVERATRGADRRVRGVEESVYADSDTEVAIASSTGLAGSYRRTDAWCYSIALVTEGDETQVGFDFELGRGLGALDAAALGRRAAERGLRVLGARKIPSTRLPVVFDPYVAGQFLGVLGSALTGEAVQKGRSLFAGRLGEPVASETLTLVDDGRAPGAPGSAPWDGEGVPTQRTEVVRDGVLHSYLYDVRSARREGRASTGNAARAGFSSPPHPAPTNLAFDPTGQSADDVMRSAGRALLVQDFHGVHSGANPVSGDFSVGATGMLLEDGAPTRPVREVTIAAPMLDVLAGIVAVADDRRWLPFGGSYGGATTLVAEMTVAGE